MKVKSLNTVLFRNYHSCLLYLRTWKLPPDISLAATVCLFEISVDQGPTTRSPNAKCDELGIKRGEINFASFLKKVALQNGIFHFFVM